MTLPNSYSNSKNKLVNLYNEAILQKTHIEFNKDTQEAVIRTLNKSRTVNFHNNPIVDLSIDWVIPDIGSVNGQDEVTSVYKNWAVAVSGITLEETIGLKHNYLVKFGGATSTMDIQILSDTLVREVNYNSVTSKTEKSRETIIFYFGIYISQDPGVLVEFQLAQMELMLNLTFVNPNFYQ